MTNKMKVTAKDEKQAIINASKQLNMDESKLKISLVKEGKKFLFGIFKDESEYEVSYEVDDNKQELTKFSVENKSDLNYHDKTDCYSNVEYTKIEDIPDEDMRKKATMACEYLDSILSLLNVGEISKSLKFDGNNNLTIDLSGQNVAVVVGRFGEVLDAIQYLVVLSANRDGGRYMKVMLDSGNFRKNRKKSLQHLSKRIARKAINDKKTVSLEPMNPYERRIIHSYISEIDGVYSKSVGTDPHRRVVVYPKGWSGENLDYKKPNRNKQSNRKKPVGISRADSGVKNKNYKFSTYDFEKEFLKSVESERSEYGKIDFKEKI